MTGHAAEFEAVAGVIADYFDGLHHSDTGRLRSVFHPKAQYVSATDGTLLYRTVEEYLPVVDARPSPASRGEARADRILSIEFAGPFTARATLNCAIGDKFFTDWLTFIKVDDRWQVISKVFHHEPRKVA
ncbi:MAG: nuclear transport factor 2 family protein [Proteobacteria bacterium]|nr:nuclear transport factor 2 family protein [Pseudomonadota bacterium]